MRHFGHNFEKMAVNGVLDVKNNAYKLPGMQMYWNTYVDI